MIVDNADVGDYKVARRHDERTQETDFVIENSFTGECKTPGKEKRRDSRSAETETAILSISLPKIICLSIGN